MKDLIKKNIDINIDNYNLIFVKNVFYLNFESGKSEKEIEYNLKITIK